MENNINWDNLSIDEFNAKFKELYEELKRECGVDIDLRDRAFISKSDMVAQFQAECQRLKEQKNDKREEIQDHEDKMEDKVDWNSLSSEEFRSIYGEEMKEIQGDVFLSREDQVAKLQLLKAAKTGKEVQNWFRLSDEEFTAEMKELYGEEMKELGDDIKFSSRLNMVFKLQMLREAKTDKEVTQNLGSMSVDKLEELLQKINEDNQIKRDQLRRKELIAKIRAAQQEGKDLDEQLRDANSKDDRGE